MQIVLAEQVHGDEDVIHIAEDQRFLLGIAILLLEECLGVVAPVATGVQVVGSMVSIVKGEAVALVFVSRGFRHHGWDILTGTSIRVILDK